MIEVSISSLESVEDDLNDDCECATSYVFSGIGHLKSNFANKKQTERVSVVRSMLLALTSKTNANNNHTKINHALRGNKVCRAVFASVTNLSMNSIYEHAAEVANSDEFSYSKR